jgi:hypothetical protein
MFETNCSKRYLEYADADSLKNVSASEYFCRDPSWPFMIFAVKQKSSHGKIPICPTKIISFQMQAILKFSFFLTEQ